MAGLLDSLREILNRSTQNLQAGTEAMMPKPKGTPESKKYGGIRATRVSDDPSNALNFVMPGLTMNQTLQQLASLHGSPFLSKESKTGLVAVYNAIKKGLFGKKTYDPLEKLIISDNPQALGSIMGLEEAVAEHPSIFSYLDSNYMDSLRKSSSWPIAQELYNDQRLIPPGLLEGNKSVFTISPGKEGLRGFDAKLLPVKEARTAPHEFSHLAHLMGDDQPWMGQILGSMYDPTSRVALKRKILESYPRPEGNINKALFNIQYANDVLNNPNEVIAEAGALKLQDLLGGK